MEQAGAEGMSQMDQLRQEIADTIANSRKDIQKEAETTKNGWFKCFTTHLATIKLLLKLGVTNGIISDDKYREFSDIIEKITERIRKLHLENPDAKDIDEGLKGELFSDLEAIGQGL